MSFIHANTDVLKKVLKEESCNLIGYCFYINFMKANPTNVRKFVLGKGHMMILLLKLSVKMMSLFKV